MSMFRTGEPHRCRTVRYSLKNWRPTLSCPCVLDWTHRVVNCKSPLRESRLRESRLRESALRESTVQRGHIRADRTTPVQVALDDLRPLLHGTAQTNGPCVGLEQNHRQRELSLIRTTVSPSRTAGKRATPRGCLTEGPANRATCPKRARLHSRLGLRTRAAPERGVRSRKRTQRASPRRATATTRPRSDRPPPCANHLDTEVFRSGSRKTASKS